MAEIITLTTDRLIIRDLNYDNLDFIHVIHSAPEVQKYATLCIPESIDESKDYLTKYIEQQNHSLFIELRKKKAGMISLALDGMLIEVDAIAFMPS